MGADGAGLAPTQELYLELLEEYYPMPGANGTGLAPQQELSVDGLAQIKADAQTEADADTECWYRGC